MKNLDEVKVSVYVSVHAKKNDAVTLLAVLAAIKNGKVKDVVWAARRYWADGDGKAANAMKQKLPCFTPSGLFEGGHAVKNLIEATGFIILDFDEVDDLENLRAVCEGDPHTVSGFKSPLKGYKAIAHVENADGRHREAYELVRAHYEKITGLQVDVSGKDISRTCYFSYDPDCYIAALYDSFVLIPPCEAPTIPPCEGGQGDVPFAGIATSNGSSITNGTSPQPPSQGGENSFAGRETDFIRANLLLHPLREGNRNQGAFILGCKAAKAGCSLEAVYANLAKEICNEDFTKEELKRTLESAYQKVVSEQNSMGKKGDKGAEITKSPNYRYRAMENDAADENAYREGEELRRKTPLFGDEVYENIPFLLAECMEEELMPRSRDVRLLASLTVLSSLLPCTQGQYRGKRYTPHLYAWVIAPPASGKGAAEAALHLTDVLQDILERESDKQLKEYSTKLDDYNDCRRRNKKSKEKVEVPERPEEPPYRSLVIPANTSLSRLIIQLRDNGNLGGLLFDTEAESLSNANKQDYGHLDSVLCKASEHETVSSAYLVNGKKPVSYRRPRLAMMLTGTPTQVTDLLGYAEKGLASRTLILTYGRDYRYEPAGEGAESTEDRFEQLAERAYGLYRFCQEHPLSFHFGKAQWKELNRTFERLDRAAYLEERDDLAATVNRYKRTVMRVAMVLTRLEQFDDGNTSRHLTCSEAAFRAALSIVLCCFEHCRLLFTSFQRPAAATLKDPDRKHFPLERLPDRFTRAEAVKVGETCGMTARQVDRRLEKLNEQEIRKLGHGCYEKVDVQGI